MNNKTILWALVAIAAFGGVWYLFANALGTGTGGATATTTPSVSAPAPQAAAPRKPAAPAPTKTTAKTAGVSSLSALLATKEPLVCSIKTTSGTIRSGTLYLSPGKARINFTDTSMIDDSAYLYAWTKGATIGTKLLASLGASGSAMVYNGGVDPAADLSFACNPWSADMSVFTPPSTVSF